MSDNYMEKLEKDIKDLEYKINHRLEYNTKIGVIRNFKLLKVINKGLIPYYISFSVVTGIFQVTGLNAPFITEPITLDSNTVDNIIKSNVLESNQNINQVNTIKLHDNWEKNDDKYSRTNYYFKIKNLDLEGVKHILETEPMKIIPYIDFIKKEIEYKDKRTLNDDRLTISSYDFESNEYKIIKENKKNGYIFLSSAAYTFLIYILGLILSRKFKYDLEANRDIIKENYKFIKTNDLKKLKIKVKIRKSNLKRIKGE